MRGLVNLFSIIKSLRRSAEVVWVWCTNEIHIDILDKFLWEKL